MVLRSGVRSSFRRNGRYFEKNGQVPNLRSMRLTLSGTRGTCEYEREILPGQRERSDTSSAAPCSVWCRQSSGSTRSLAERLSASLSLCSASTRRSPATSGRCWACRRLAMVADKGARWQGTGRGYIVSCALRRLKHALVPVVGSNAIRIFKRLLSTGARFFGSLPGQTAKPSGAVHLPTRCDSR